MVARPHAVETYKGVQHIVHDTPPLSIVLQHPLRHEFAGALRSLDTSLFLILLHLLFNLLPDTTSRYNTQQVINNLLNNNR